MAIPLWLFTVIHKSPPKYTQVYLLRMDTNYNFIIIRLSIRNGIRKIELCYRKTYPDKHYIYSWQSETCSGECTCLQTTGSLNTNAVHGVLVTFQRRVEIVQQKQTIITRRTTRYRRSCENSLLFHPCNVPPPPSPTRCLFSRRNRSGSCRTRVGFAQFPRQASKQAVLARERHPRMPLLAARGDYNPAPDVPADLYTDESDFSSIPSTMQVVMSFYIMIYQVYRSNIYP